MSDPIGIRYRRISMKTEGEAPDPCVVHGAILDRQRIHQMIADHNPVPTTRSPVSRWRVVINLPGSCFVLTAAHAQFYSYGVSEKSRVLG